MVKNLIQVKHSLRDYECMWSGIEDLYNEKIGEIVPPFFFFSISGTGNFIYTKDESGARRAAWSTGMVKQMYQFMAPIAGFKFQYVEELPFEEAMAKAKEEIDQGRPVVLGPLDMFYLKYYPKIYHHMHIPYHYIMMVGYDEGSAYVLEGGKVEMQSIEFADLKLALDVQKTDLGDKNTICLIDFEEEVTPMLQIAKRGFAQKAKAMLEPRMPFVGIPAMRRFAEEFPHWKEEMSIEAYKESLNFLITYTGTVPQPPMKLFGAKESPDILHQAAFEKLVDVLNALDKRYQVPKWKEAAILFEQCGSLIEQITDSVVSTMLGKGEDFASVSKLTLNIADLETAAYKALLEGCK